jgi:hypothetical protein
MMSSRSGCADHEAIALDEVGAAGQLLIDDAAPIASWDVSQDVEAARVGHPGRDLHRCKGPGIELHGQQFGFVVGHSLDLKTRAQLLHSAGEPVEVDWVVAHDAVRVIRQPRSPVADRGKAADDHVLDAVAVERGDDANDVELRRRRIFRRRRYLGRRHAQTQAGRGTPEPFRAS